MELYYSIESNQLLGDLLPTTGFLENVSLIFSVHIEKCTEDLCNEDESLCAAPENGGGSHGTIYGILGGIFGTLAGLFICCCGVFCFIKFKIDT